MSKVEDNPLKSLDSINKAITIEIKKGSIIKEYELDENLFESNSTSVWVV
jgi:hypothetical protein